MAVIDLDLNPDRKALRVFGIAAFVAFLALAILGWQLWHLPSWACLACAGISLLSGLFSLALPAANRALYVVLTLLAYPVGLVVSFVVMGILYYGVLTPVGLIFRLIGRDVLRTKPDPSGESFWVQRESETELSRYYRQF